MFDAYDVNAHNASNQVDRRQRAQQDTAPEVQMFQDQANDSAITSDQNDQALE